MKKPAYFAIILTVLMTAALLPGCGEANQGEAVDSGGIQLEVGADIATVVEDAAVQSGDAFRASDLPIDEGLRLEYAANPSGTSTPVSFTLKGPWKFTSSPEDATMIVAVSSKKGVPSEKEFPDAAIAAGTSWIAGASGNEYVYEGRDDTAWLSYGRVTADGRIITYTSPSKALVFPLTVGDKWNDSYSEETGSQTTVVVAENEVLSRNQLTVPAGTFDAWLVQTKVTAKSRTTSASTIDYSWYVPGIGRAAEIISLPGEKHTPFKTAQAFYRLKNHN